MPDDFHSFQAECAVAHQRTPAARRSTATVGGGATGGRRPTGPEGTSVAFGAGADVCTGGRTATRVGAGGGVRVRSEEHTSELQSRLHLVCRLLLEKKKK